MVMDYDYESREDEYLAIKQMLAMDEEYDRWLEAEYESWLEREEAALEDRLDAQERWLSGDDTPMFCDWCSDDKPIYNVYVKVAVGQEPVPMWLCKDCKENA